MIEGCAGRGWVWTLSAVVCVVLGASEARGFALLNPPGGATVAETLERAARFPPSVAPSPAIQVGVEPGFASQLGATGGQIAQLDAAVVAAFAAWESPALDFDVALEASGVAEGAEMGFEIDVFAVPATHPIFSGTNFFGFASVGSCFESARVLTNGESADGLVVTGADVYINIDNVNALAQGFGLSEQEQVDALARLLTHEIGHALGLGHPNSNHPFGLEDNYDTDSDPLNVMQIDGANPFAGIALSAQRDDTAIMSNRPCGEPLVSTCPALFSTSLANDDAGGRDVLYPVPEPGRGAAAATALTSLLVVYRHRAATCATRTGILPRDPEL